MIAISLSHSKRKLLNTFGIRFVRAAHTRCSLAVLDDVFCHPSIIVEENLFCAAAYPIEFVCANRNWKLNGKITREISFCLLHTLGGEGGVEWLFIYHLALNSGMIRSPPPASCFHSLLRSDVSEVKRCWCTLHATYWQQTNCRFSHHGALAFVSHLIDVVECTFRTQMPEIELDHVKQSKIKWQYLFF